MEEEKRREASGEDAVLKITIHPSEWTEANAHMYPAKN